MENCEPDISTTQQSPMLKFSLSRVESSNSGPRLGQLLRGGRKTIQTPHYVATTSRGVLPHISHDVLAKNTTISSMYFGIEDCKRFQYILTAWADSLLTVLPQS